MDSSLIHAETEGPLPSGFADLAPFADWCLATETARNSRRNRSTMVELLAFRDAILPRVDEVVRHLNAYSLDAMPAPEQRLMHMLLSLAEIAPAVEAYHQPGVIDGYDPARFVADEHFVMRPAL